MRALVVILLGLLVAGIGLMLIGQGASRVLAELWEMLR